MQTKGFRGLQAGDPFGKAEAIAGAPPIGSSSAGRGEIMSSERTYYAKRKSGEPLQEVSKYTLEASEGENLKSFRATSIREARKLAIVWHNLESERERARKRGDLYLERKRAEAETAERRRRAFDRRVSLSGIAEALAGAFGEDLLFGITSEARRGRS